MQHRVRASRLLRPVSFAFLGVLAGIGCGHDESPSRRMSRKAPGIVLLCIDTLRADAVGLPGGRPGSMPHLEAFARDATSFADASSSAPWTPPSIATLLTGLLPSRHGVNTEDLAPPLVPGVTTLAEVLRGAGWSTSACTSGGWVSPGQGLGQGFDGFTSGFDQLGPEAALAAWDGRRPKDKPFFLFLHTFAAHDPYGDKRLPSAGKCAATREGSLDPQEMLSALRVNGGLLPESLKTRFAITYLTDACGRKALSDVVGAEALERAWPSQSVFDWIHGDYAKLPSRVEIEDRVRAGYRAGLAYADDVFHRTETTLRSLGLPEETVFVVVGDHGEAFGEHGVLYHGLKLYDELLRVPMIVRASGVLPPGHVVRGSAGLVDLPATLLELAGAPPLEDIDGRSLLPFLHGKEGGHPVLAEAGSGDPEKFARTGIRLISARNERAKWILTFHPDDGETLSEVLYDLRLDPGETRPLRGVSPDRFGADFCLGVYQARSRVHRLAGREAPEQSCGALK